MSIWARPWADHTFSWDRFRRRADDIQPDLYKNISADSFTAHDFISTDCVGLSLFMSVRSPLYVTSFKTKWYHIGWLRNYRVPTHTCELKIWEKVFSKLKFSHFERKCQPIQLGFVEACCEDVRMIFLQNFRP